MLGAWKRPWIGLALWTVAAAAGCGGPDPVPIAERAAPPADPTLAEINDDYVASVKPLFVRSCASCHGSAQSLPWYHSLPLVRGMIDDDIAKAQRTVDMSHDFPFRGRGTPADYLDAVHDVVAEGSMPPRRYRLMHWRSGLNAVERSRVLSWVERSQQRLRSEPKAPGR